jgi:uncharacterized protein (DUF1800 family)
MAVVWNEEQAAHLLSRAGFGGTDRDVRRFARRGLVASVTQLVSPGGSSARGPGESEQDREKLEDLKVWWIKRMVKANSRRLQEKMCLFWHDHFATSFDVVKNNLWMAQQNQTFRRVGLGDFHTLVVEITRDPAMLDFLDGRTSTRNRPNENYARELMELFTLGVTDVNGVENYTQTDVEELTRALTGFQIEDDRGVFNPNRWDGGVKTLFAGTGHQATGNLGVVDATGALLPPPRNVIDILFTHRDTDGDLTLPRFLARKLWEYFAYPLSPPPMPADEKALLDSLTGTFVGNGFVIRDLLVAIFTHDEFYGDAAKTRTVKNPCEFAFHAIRALRATTRATTVPAHLAEMGMDLFDPPGVNGWNQGLAWLSSGQLLARIQFAQALAAGRDSELRFIPQRVIDTTATDAGAVVDALLDRLGVSAHVPAGVRATLVDYFEGATDFRDPEVLERKVRGAVVLMLGLPEFHIH